MKSLKTIIVLSLILIMSKSMATTFYVATNGSDANNGTESSPWKTLQKAAASITGGDTVYVKAGVYKGEVQIKKSGSENEYILFSAFPGDEEKVIIDGSQMLLIDASYVQVSGFYIRNTSNHGIAVRGVSDGVIISGNHTYDTYGSGISVWGVDWGQDPSEYDYDYIRDIVIENNKIEKACNGGWNECITLANGVNNFQIINNELFNGGDPTNGGEGIDVKEGCAFGLISGNVIHGLTRRGIYLDGGGHFDEWDTPNLHDIYVTQNRVYSNPNGQAFAIMTEGSADVHDIFVYNNLFYDNGEDGIMLYDHPNGDGDVYDISIINNTCYNNKRFGFLLNFPQAENIIFRNNICYKSGNSNIKFEAGYYAAAANLTKDPYFVNADAGDFHLKKGSPAIDAGTDEGAPDVDFDGNSRPYAYLFDIGAFEFMGASTVEKLKDCQSSENLNLYRNFPNPFNPETLIKYDVNTPSHVSLKIFNIQGQLVDTLVNEKKNQGNYSIVWNAADFANGMYVCVLSSENTHQVQRMVLAK